MKTLKTRIISQGHSGELLAQGVINNSCTSTSPYLKSLRRGVNFDGLLLGFYKSDFKNLKNKLQANVKHYIFAKFANISCTRKFPVLQYSPLLFQYKHLNDILLSPWKTSSQFGLKAGPGWKLTHSVYRYLSVLIVYPMYMLPEKYRMSL